MKDIDKAVIVIACLVALSILCFVVKWVAADDGSGCRQLVFDGQVGDCYAPKIYQQNQILFQELNQTNKLLAYQFCNDQNVGSPYEYEWVHEGGFGNFHFEDCVNKVLNDTR